MAQPDDASKSLAELRQELADTESQIRTLADEVAACESGGAPSDAADEAEAAADVPAVPAWPGRRRMASKCKRRPDELAARYE